MFPYITPFLMGILIAAVIHPAVDYCELKGCPRGLVSLILVLIIFGSLLFLIGFAVVGLWNEVDQLIQLFQTLYSGGYRAFEDINQFVQTLPEPIRNMVPAITENLNQFVIGLLIEVLNFVKQIPNTFFTWILAAMTAFFVCRDKREIARFITGLMPKSWHTKFFVLKHQVVQGLFAYLKAQLILMWISACIAISGFLLVNQAYAWVLGILVGLFDLIPVLGPAAVFLPVIIFNLFSGLTAKGIFIGLVWLILMVIRQIWEPQIMGSQIGLHPLSATAALYLGVKAMGAAGFIFGPIIAIFGKAIYFILRDD